MLSAPKEGREDRVVVSDMLEDTSARQMSVTVQTMHTYITEMVQIKLTSYFTAVRRPSMSELEGTIMTFVTYFGL